MADESKAGYTKELVEVYEEAVPDELIQDVSTVSEIVLSGAGKYERGTLLMINSDGDFERATSAGIVTSEELCILAENIEFETDYAETFGYFCGTFNASAIILPEEEEMTTAVKAFMRKHKLFVR